MDRLCHRLTNPELLLPTLTVLEILELPPLLAGRIERIE
jgi:hypothetical protein